MEKIRIKEVIVVEGRDDTTRLKQFFDVKTIETGGSGVSAHTIEQIRRAINLHGVIIFTDPDVSGEQIRREIVNNIPTAKHAFLRRNEGVPSSKEKGRSLGIEHASFNALKEALQSVYSVKEMSEESQLSQTFLNQIGLTLGSDAKKRRIFLGEQLRIGYANAKQLKKRLELFQISEATIQEIMEDYEEK